MSFLSPQKKAFGIEISDASIKVLQLRKSGNSYRLHGYNITKLPPNLVLSGEIKNQNQVAQYIQKAVSEAKPSRISTTNVVCSLPENKTFVRILYTPLMSKEEFQEGIKWEAEQYIPLPIDTVYYDWQILKIENNKQKVLIAAAPKKLVDSYINILKIAKLKPIVLDLEEAAQARALILEEKESQAVLIVDIGATKTVFTIYDQKIVPFASNTQEISGNKFTEYIAKALKIRLEDAEAKKVACCSPKLTEEEKLLLQSVSPLFDNLCNQIFKIMDYYKNHFKTANEIEKIVLCGGGAAFSSLIPEITLKLKKKVIMANPLINLQNKNSVRIEKKDIFSLTTVMGLGIRGADILKYSKT